MEKLTVEEKKANREAYLKTIHHPRKGEPLVPVRVMSNPGFWYCPTPNTGKMYAEGEELMVPEHVWLNSNYDTENKSISGMLLRGILRRTDIHQAKDGAKVAQDDIKALIERNRELERKLLILTGTPPTPEPLVVPDQPATSKEEEEI